MNTVDNDNNILVVGRFYLPRQISQFILVATQGALHRQSTTRAGATDCVSLGPVSRRRCCHTLLRPFSHKQRVKRTLRGAETAVGNLTLCALMSAPVRHRGRGEILRREKRGRGQTALRSGGPSRRAVTACVLCFKIRRGGRATFCRAEASPSVAGN